MLRWIWSDDPADWISQLGGIFAMLTAIFTGIYVLLTYHLMRSSIQTAKLALAETQRSRLRHLVPIKRTLDALHAAIMMLLTEGEDGMLAMAAGLAKERLDLAGELGSAVHVSEEMDASLRACSVTLEATSQLIARRMERGGASFDFHIIQKAAERALTAIRAATAVAESELSRSRGIIKNAECRHVPTMTVD